ncbi:MAG: gamma-glutamyltransferase family protein [Burkholderiales bacterium]|nr:gamma-glutamyltransferase family protein [Burkholderiales bacterium]MDE1929192.1 gamma-glutamyltransferase family protein [Burkholderiales bacterium]MDE2159888.1 gamma-glutamyltransferase family protein [Burkholderiales bacterium]MDE2502083.1 gamma-glutamyltransferase family protein [Burkholderiales bacterium]
MSHPTDWSVGYASRRQPVFARNVVSTSHPLAAQAGLRMLQSGGNAVDAAIAAAAVMTIVEPCSNGLGSDAFAIVWDGARLQGLNASGCAPAAWTPDYFERKYGAGATTPPRRGWDAVTVPGAVAGWVALHERYGRLPFPDLLAPAIDVAERGYAVPVIVQQKWAAAAALPEIASQPGFAAAFLPHGRAPQVGEMFSLPAAARTLRLIALTTGEAFYGGEVAAAAAAHARAHGGAMSAADFAAYRPLWVDPIACDYRGWRLHEIPPNGQGIAALMALGMVERFDLGALPVDGAAIQHLQIEAMKLAFADVYRHVADPQAMRLTPAQMLDPDYLARRAALIDPQRAQDFGPGLAPQGGTIYLSAADERGMMVSFIQSNYMGFGSGIVVPGYGLSLQNRGHGFTLDRTRDNCVAPGKRPFHTIIPAFLTRDGRPVMSFGVMGGDMQPQGHLQTLVRMIDLQQNPQAACDAPRWRWAGGQLHLEDGIPAATAEGLRALGHRIEPHVDSYQDFGAGQFIWRLDEGRGDAAERGYAAASDPRRDGQAAGC